MHFSQARLRALDVLAILAFTWIVEVESVDKVDMSLSAGRVTSDLDQLVHLANSEGDVGLYEASDLISSQVLEKYSKS